MRLLWLEVVRHARINVSGKEHIPDHIFYLNNISEVYNHVSINCSR